MSSPEDHLRDAWAALGGSAHDATADLIVERHTEPHRAYHTATHVSWVLRHAGDLLRAEPPPPERLADDGAIRAAALFHDIVYDPRSSTNESDSAALAVDALQPIGWDEDRCARVAALIEATAGHEAASFEEAILLDADLAILGSDPADYADYVAAVRFEYAFVGDDAWRTGRTAVLRSFLDREQIFATATMRAQREARARANLATELRSLI